MNNSTTDEELVILNAHVETIFQEKKKINPILEKILFSVLT